VKLEDSQEGFSSMELVKYYHNHQEILNEWVRLTAQLSPTIIGSQEGAALE
jgi:hypothetical protein